MSNTDDTPPKKPGLSELIGKKIRHYLEAHGVIKPPTGLYHKVMEEVERPLIRECLEYTGNNQVRTAKMLGISRNTLRRKINLYDIDLN
jgi:two-component system nitrogen regulation response regulator GlnG